MPFGYPVFLELAGRRAVVIGGTAIREGKVEGLLAADIGEVTVVAERPDAHLESLAAVDDRVTIERRSWRADDLDDAFVCVASSNDPAERSAIARGARDRGVLVNVMDDIPNCDWAAPSVVRRGELATGDLDRRRVTRVGEEAPAATLDDVRRGVGRGALRPARGARVHPAVPSRHRRALDTVGRGARHGRGRRPRPRGAGRRPPGAARSPAARGSVRRSGRRAGHRLPGRGGARRPEADHGSWRRAARPRRRRRLRPLGVAGAVGPGAFDRRTDLRRQGARPFGDAPVRDRRATRVSRAPWRDGRALERRGSLRVRSRRRGDARVRGGWRRVRGGAGDHERRRGAGAGGDTGHPSRTGAELRGRHRQHRARRRGRPRARGDLHGHARRVDGCREAGRDVRRADRGGPARNRARRDRPVVGHARAAHDRRDLGGSADARRDGADRTASDPRGGAVVARAGSGAGRRCGPAPFGRRVRPSPTEDDACGESADGARVRQESVAGSYASPTAWSVAAALFPSRSEPRTIISVPLHTPLREVQPDRRLGDRAPYIRRGSYAATGGVPDVAGIATTPHDEIRAGPHRDTSPAGFHGAGGSIRQVPPAGSYATPTPTWRHCSASLPPQKIASLPVHTGRASRNRHGSRYKRLPGLRRWIERSSRRTSSRRRGPTRPRGATRVRSKRTRRLPTSSEAEAARSSLPRIRPKDRPAWWAAKLGHVRRCA